MGTRERIGIDITATDRTAAAFASVQRSMSGVQVAQQEMAKFSRPMMAAAGNSNKFAGAIQNVSFQVQDFAVQVASGTSAARAFAQQAPQLLSGFGVLGAVLGAVVAVAIPLAAHFMSSATAMTAFGGAIQTIAPYAAVATAALAGFYAPQLLAGLAMTTSAIGTGLVGAIRAVTAAMLLNPLGALVAGIAAAAVAIFAFRDDIKQVFGVDVAGTIKDSVNWTIDKLAKLASTIAAVWGRLGDIVGNAMVGTANVVLRAMTAMVNGAIGGINKLIDSVNSLSDYSGITLGKFQELQAAQLANPFAAGAAQAGSEMGRIWAESQVKDYVGTMATLAGSAMSRVAELFSGGMLGGGAAAQGGGATAKGAADDIYGVGMLDKTFSKLWQNMSEGIPAIDGATQAFGQMASTITNSLASGLEGLISGTMSVKEAFADMARGISQQLSQLASQLLTSSIMRFLQYLPGLLAGGGGAGFSFAGMMFGGLRAAGGPVMAGRSYIVGERGPEIFAPGKSGQIIPTDRPGSSGASSAAFPQMNVTVINNSSASVSTRKNQRGDLELMIEEMMSDKLSRGGNKIDSALQRGYGLKRAGR